MKESRLKIIRAVYYDPELGSERGTDVTAELSAEICDDRLFYNGIYNRILPDNFETKHKKLKIEYEYKNIKGLKIYDEDGKINLPNDIGKINKPVFDFKNSLIVKILIGVVIGVISGIILYYLFYSKPI